VDHAVKRYIAVIFLCVLSYGAYKYAMRAVDSLRGKPDEQLVSRLYSDFSHRKDAAYLVFGGDEKITVYLQDGKTLFLQNSVPISMLPATDRAMLKKGLEICDEEELLLLLEDLCS